VLRTFTNLPSKPLSLHAERRHSHVIITRVNDSSESLKTLSGVECVGVAHRHELALEASELAC